jgi:hypothetical protein
MDATGFWYSQTLMAVFGLAFVTFRNRCFRRSRAGSSFGSIIILMAEQLRSIRALYEKKGCSEKFQFVYLPMPLCLRESGSFGTHWMLQPKIRVESKTADSRTLSGEEIIKLLRVLHGQSEALSADGRTVLEWAREDEGWSSGARELGLTL